jgi:hypothetical protein
MATQSIYVPILKGKEGEFAALETLKPDIQPYLMPLIEIPDVPYDYANERPAKSPDEYLRGIVERLDKSWTRPLYVDLPWTGEKELLDDGRVALEAVLTDCAERGVKAVPVVSRVTSTQSLSVAGRYSESEQTGACIRLLVEDFEEDIDLEVEIDRMVAGLGTVPTGSVDLVVDLEDLRSDSGRALLVARSVFSMIPKKEFRCMILAAASFPEDLSEVDAATVTRLPRREWELWKSLQKRPKNLPRRDLIFGDYAITHPSPKELDPRTMRMSASIRYTTPDYWLVLKGRNVRQYGFDQYFDLCKELVDRPEYASMNFSWGDRFIRDCADGISGPGNATTWRKVGTNHHITRVIADLRNGV